MDNITFYCIILIRFVLHKNNNKKKINTAQILTDFKLYQNYNKPLNTNNCLTEYNL